MPGCGQVTVAAGHTDLCRLSCTGPDSHLRFRENLRQALDILSFLPNVIIALVLPLDPSLVQEAEVYWTKDGRGTLRERTSLGKLSFNNLSRRGRGGEFSFFFLDGNFSWEVN